MHVVRRRFHTIRPSLALVFVMVFTVAGVPQPQHVAQTQDVQSIPGQLLFIPFASVQEPSTPPIFAQTQESPLPTPVATLPPYNRVYVPPTPAPITWDKAPICENHPLTVAGWQQRLQTDAEKKAAPPLERVWQLSPSLRTLGDAAQLRALMLQDAGADVQVRFTQDLLAVWLNVAQGKLNQATKIQLAAFTAVTTVGDLLHLAAQTPADKSNDDELHQALQQVLAGQAITDPVCGHWLVVHSFSDLRSVVWSGTDITHQSVPLDLAGTKLFAALGSVSVSPDTHYVAIESFGYEHGGPIFLYDRESQSVINLIQAVTSRSDREHSLSYWWGDGQNWHVIGWHPSSRYILLGIDDQSAAIWVDLVTRTYDTISFLPPEDVYTGPDFVTLLPSGSGFVYISRIQEKPERFRLGRVYRSRLNLGSKEVNGKR